jgi:predicted glycogen debranching enzyme
VILLGRQTLGALQEGSAREWLLADGLGGYAMGTASGLLTRRYHGLLVVADRPPAGRMAGLLALDPVLVRGDAVTRLGVHEWAGGAVAPAGHAHLVEFALRDGLPRWRWQVGDVVLEREVAMAHGRPLVAVVLRLVRADGPVRVEAEALCTWRDVHGERAAGAPPAVEADRDGFAFEGRYRVEGPGYVPAGEWYRGLRHREEAARGLPDTEDVWFAGRFGADLLPGQALTITARADAPLPAPPAEAVVAAARTRAREVVAAAAPADDAGRLLALAADRFVARGPLVVAGYPWFGEWGRDSFTSYEGLFLCTGRAREGRRLLVRAAGLIDEGMLPNTTDLGEPGYNTIDGTLWFCHAAGRHVEATGDTDLAVSLRPAMAEVVARHLAGTRYGIRADAATGLLRGGQEGAALTWMDARVDGVPVTRRAGAPVEVNALWLRALDVATAFAAAAGADPGPAPAVAGRLRRTIPARYLRDGAVLDVVDGPGGDDASVRPNALLAVSLPGAAITDPGPVRRVRAALMTPLGPRSLAPGSPGYAPVHRGGPAERDRAYHRGTVWPWLIGPYVEACLRTGEPVDGVLDGLESHLGDFGLGSVSETADGDAPNAATGCPFQAWSVAELIRARAMVARGAPPP